MAETEGRGHLLSTKQTACILTDCTNYRENFLSKCDQNTTSLPYSCQNVTT